MVDMLIEYFLVIFVYELVRSLYCAATGRDEVGFDHFLDAILVLVPLASLGLHKLLKRIDP